ncbi:MAG: oligosaccharide flippase family protein [Deltaproteobacteria bacterium]|nr:oligosaccharide flippase family protein [Deltaproteobacteria bacterium]
MAGTTKSLITGSFLRTIGLAVNVITAFFIMPFVIHNLGDRWYGIWVIVGGFMGYYGLLDFGITSATNRFIAMHIGRNENREVNIAFNTSLGMFTIVGTAAAIVSLIIVCFAPYFVKNPADIVLLRKVLFVMGLDIAVSFPLRTFTAILAAKLRYDLISYSAIAKTLLRAALIVYFIGKGYSVFSLAVITLVVNMSERLSMMVFAWKNFPLLKIKLSLFDRYRIKEYLNYSVYTFMASIGDMIRFKLDIMVIAFFLGSVLVTHYNIALSLHEYSGQLVFGLITGTLPVLVGYYANNDFENLREKFMMLTRFGLVISIAVSGAVIILAQPFINRWMGANYLDAILPLVILRIVSALGVGQNSSVQILYAMAKHKFYAYMTLGEAIANLILSLLLVKPYGMAGVALGTAIPFVVTKFFIMPPYVCKLLKLPVKQYYSQLIKLIVVPGAAHIPFYFLIQYFQVSSYFSMILAGAGYYLVYGYCLLHLLLPQADRSYLVEAMPYFKKILA